MNKIIEQICKMQQEENPCFFTSGNREQSKKEWGLYDELYAGLSGKTRAMFLEYTNVCAERHADSVRAAYEKGFKDAMRLLLESLKK